MVKNFIIALFKYLVIAAIVVGEKLVAWKKYFEKYNVLYEAQCAFALANLLNVNYHDLPSSDAS